MFKVQFVVVACFAAAVLAKPSPHSEGLESAYNRAIRALDSVELDAEYVKDIEQVKESLKSALGSVQNQADISLNEALGEAEDVARIIAKEDESSSDIIEKIKKCLKQVIEKGKGRAEAISKELKKIINDIVKLKDCKGPKKEKDECIKNIIASVKEDIGNLMDESSKQIQWLFNDALPDFYECVIK